MDVLEAHPLQSARKTVQGDSAPPGRRARRAPKWRPSAEQLETQALLLERLGSASAPLGGALRRFGSCTTGLQTSASDLDLTWIRRLPTEPPEHPASSSSARPQEEQRRRVVEELRELLAAIGGVSSVDGDTVVFRDRRFGPGVASGRLVFAVGRRWTGAPPVLRLESHSGEQVCDITLDNWEGLRTPPPVRQR